MSNNLELPRTSERPKKAPKARKCRICRQEYAPRGPMQRVCSPDCAVNLAVVERNKRELTEKRATRKEIKARKEKIKTRGEWMAETQRAVNAFRRHEELAKGRGCISCGRTQPEVQSTDGWKPGGAWDAGHFVGVGARPAIRLEPKNIWLQCKSCNAGSAKYARKASTVSAAYEINLRAQEGDELVDWLKGPHEPKKYTIDELRQLRDHYRAKLRELKLQRE